MTNSPENKGLPKLTQSEILECLTRSGYVLESRLIQSLSNDGFFVEPNQVTLDPRTGKSREIDLIAEYYNREAASAPGSCVKTFFPIEAVNNPFPFVLLSRRIWTPQSPTDSYVQYVTTPKPNSFEDQIGDWYEEKQPVADKLFSQYCGITRKKSSKDFMAYHPDDIYTSFLKLAEYVANELRYWESRNIENDKYWRLFFWRPCLVLSGDLLALETDTNGELGLTELDFGQLEFNWHSEEFPATTVIDVIREEYLLNHLKNIAIRDEDTQRALHQFREKYRH
ncbi:MAG: hypothetical protein KF824_05375 [Fimbriimonadaceae bacterium]|nr:MAG: hypothetical protein KF824_05375 [Fimbriimonadaceae bacterium]